MAHVFSHPNYLRVVLLWYVQVACGGCYTLAVCRHDADKEDTEERRRGYKGKMRAWFSTNNRPLITVPEKCADSCSCSLLDLCFRSLFCMLPWSY